jgi:hypothetical protein
MSKVHLNLQATEQVIVQAAATIYAAYVSAGRIKMGDEDMWLERAIREAIRIAKTTDAAVVSDTEVS